MTKLPIVGHYPTTKFGCKLIKFYVFLEGYVTRISDYEKKTLTQHPTMLFTCSQHSTNMTPIT